MGAKITGYSLNPPTTPNLYDICGIDKIATSIIADIRDYAPLHAAVRSSRPDIIFHMAAQSLVGESYKNPSETYAVNVMGTVNLFETLRTLKGTKAVLNVTTDKCYENREWVWGYRENEPLGGYDPYSNSKACSELVTASYRSSFFNPKDYSIHGLGLATARAGNVIGGGDWATDRLLPDCIRALLTGENILVRNPQSVRPWQHVLEPLSGYLLLAQRLCEDGSRYSQAWNFGPDDCDAKPVEWIINEVCKKWGRNAAYRIDKGKHPHEAHYLKLDCSKAKAELGWHPRWNLEKAIEKIIEWTQAYREEKDLRKVCLKQIEDYSEYNVRA